VPPETRQKSPVARAMALRDAVNQALTGPSELKPFERELRNWANAEVQAGTRARRHWLAGPQSRGRRGLPRGRGPAELLQGLLRRRRRGHHRGLQTGRMKMGAPLAHEQRAKNDLRAARQGIATARRNEGQAERAYERA